MIIIIRILGTRSRLRPFPLPKVGWCASCNNNYNNNSNSSSNNNNNNNNVIEARRPDMIVVDKVNRYYEIIDFAIRYDSKIELKEQEKVEKYQDLRRSGVKKNVEYESKHHTNCNRTDGSNSKEAAEKIGAVGNKDAAGRTTEKCYIHCENTTKGPRTLRRLVATKLQEETIGQNNKPMCDNTIIIIIIRDAGSP